jgi:hypothetical protein
MLVRLTGPETSLGSAGSESVRAADGLVPLSGQRSLAADAGLTVCLLPAVGDQCVDLI